MKETIIRYMSFFVDQFTRMWMIVQSCVGCKGNTRGSVCTGVKYRPCCDYIIFSVRDPITRQCSSYHQPAHCTQKHCFLARLLKES